MTATNKEYCFVLDSDRKPLAPTSVNRGWFLIRKKRARLVERFPLVIQLFKVVENPQCNVVFGIDDGSVHTGVAIVQKGETRSKCVFKGTLEHRQDVKSLMAQRAGYRRKRRANKRYRKPRFDNRRSSKRTGRLPPSIHQKKQAVIRFMNKIRAWTQIETIVLEDVAIDIRALTEGYKPYKWQYQKSSRLDENLRKATIIRDGCKCQMCGKGNRELQAHHIVPKHMNGADTMSNLITLCSGCHTGIKDKETEYINQLQKKIKGKSVRLDYAQHVMQGKHWLRAELSKIAALEITNGGATANQRIDWGINKTHPNDAVAVTGLKPIKLPEKDWEIKPKRKRRKMKRQEDVCGFRHGDYVKYCDTKGVTWVGYITAMYQDKQQINIQCPTKHLKRVNARKSVHVYKCPQISIF